MVAAVVQCAFSHCALTAAVARHGHVFALWKPGSSVGIIG